MMDLETALDVARMVVADAVGKHMVLPCMSHVSLDVKTNNEEKSMEFSMVVTGKRYGKNFAKMITAHLNAHLKKLVQYLRGALKEISHAIPKCRLTSHKDQAILLERGRAKKRVLTLTLT